MPAAIQRSARVHQHIIASRCINRCAAQIARRAAGHDDSVELRRTAAERF